MTQIWSGSQTNANVTLSNGNLTGTDAGTDSIFCPSYGSEGFVSGKFYWEITVAGTGFTANHSGGGVGNTSSSTANGQYLGIGTDTIGYYSNGTIWNNAAAQASGFSTYTTGNLICFALDLDNGRFSVRVGTGGNWNNNVANTPSTGFFAIPAGVTAHSVVPAFNLYNTATPDSVVAAFAQSSWTGAAPSGFGPFDAYLPYAPWPLWAPVLAQ